MMPGWYQRMNRRERVLAWLAAGTVFALLNFFTLDWLFGAVSGAQKQMAARRAMLAEQGVFVKERDLWTERDEWIRQHQPVLKDPAEASALLDQLKEIAGKYNVLIENPAIGSGETTPYHQTIFASIETKSPWPPLVHFLYDVQRPDAFIVFESVNLAIDGSDPTMMRGKFKIARWFAPAQRTK
jgi:hypothetical protein